MTRFTYGFILMLLLGALCTASTMGQEMAGVREVYDGAMRPDVEVKTFAHSDQLFPMRVVDRGSAARHCRRRRRLSIMCFSRRAENATTCLIIWR